MPGAARLGDMCFPECGSTPFSIIEGSFDVLINGKPAATLGSSVAPHLARSARCRGTLWGKLITGNGAVLVNNKPLATMGSLQLTGGTTTPVITASPDVIVG